MKREKIQNLLLFLLILVATLSIIIKKPLGDLDELWNYSFAKNVAEGLIPYKDFNMLQMPLLPMICGLILKITFNQLIIMRILAALLCAGIFYACYQVFTILDIRKEWSLLLTLLIAFLLIDVLCIDYNYASLFIVLCIIYLEIKEYKKNNSILSAQWIPNLGIGILAGLTVTLKQTSGLCVCIVSLGYPLLFVKTKEEFVLFLKRFEIRLIGILIPVGILLSYLLMTGAFQDFISYTLKGITGFTNYISYINLVHWNLFGVISILVPITILIEWIKTIVFGKDKKSLILLVYGIAIFIITFPISDKIHFLIGSVPILILILYETTKMFKKYISRAKLEKDKIITLTLFISALILFVIIPTVCNFYEYEKAKERYSNLNHFERIPISNHLEQEIESVDRYILKQSENVKIIDASAAAYMIPLDRYHKDYDMLLKGNIGYHGEQRLIEEIKREEKMQYLVLMDKYLPNWQLPTEITDYIKDNKNKIQTIGIYDIYQ